MAQYRYQAVSVGMWRGKIKRWNTTMYRSLAGQESGFKAALQKSGWKNPGDVLGACSGGVASIAVYNVAGGAPISKQVYFDWQVPSTWVPYTSEFWAAVDPGTLLDAAGESAIIVVGHLPGLSSSGKPISTRKYLHAVPSRTAAAFGDPDVDAATQAAFAAGWAGLMGSSKGATPTTITVEPYYGNHQRVRGRRRTVNSIAAQSFSAGVVAGSGAPFPEPRIEFLNQQ